MTVIDTPGPMPKKSWAAVAIDELEAILARIRSTDDLRAEAERIHAALTVAQVQNVPTLPWKVRTAGKQVRKPITRSCARSGRSFDAIQQFRIVDGEALCRRDCPAEAAA